MDIKNYICDLADILNQKNLGEIETEISGQRVRISAKGQTASFSTVSAPQMTQTSKEVAPVTNTEVKTLEVADTSNRVYVKSPIVGTFYGASAPDADPFVSVGKDVKKGDVVCIIEAMKNMNEITSAYDGKVVEILVKDGQLVEFDQDILVLE